MSKHDVLIYKPLARGVILQAQHDLETLKPDSLEYQSAKKFLLSNQNSYAEIRTIWKMIAFMNEDE